MFEYIVFVLHFAGTLWSGHHSGQVHPGFAGHWATHWDWLPAAAWKIPWSSALHVWSWSQVSKASPSSHKKRKKEEGIKVPSVAEYLLCLGYGQRVSVDWLGSLPWRGELEKVAAVLRAGCGQPGQPLHGGKSEVTAGWGWESLCIHGGCELCLASDLETRQPKSGQECRTRHLWSQSSLSVWMCIDICYCHYSVGWRPGEDLWYLQFWVDRGCCQKIGCRAVSCSITRWALETGRLICCTLTALLWL